MGADSRTARKEHNRWQILQFYDKQALAEMSKVDRRVSPLMAGDPEMKMGQGIQLHQALMETPAGRRNRKGGEAKNRRNVKSTT